MITITAAATSTKPRLVRKFTVLQTALDFEKGLYAEGYTDITIAGFFI